VLDLLVGRDRGGVEEWCHPRASASDRLEHVDRPDHVDAGAERRIVAAERHLERGEMDDVCDLLLVERELEQVEVGDVDADPVYERELVGTHQQLHPPWVVAHVECNHVHAFAHQLANRPGADTAVGARHEESLGGLVARGEAHGGWFPPLPVVRRSMCWSRRGSIGGRSLPACNLIASPPSSKPG
jgi:hypothetical protein